MPEVKVGERKGFAIMYDARMREFSLRNSNNDEVGSGKTQEDVEKQADKLAKQKFQFPILALAVDRLHVKEGKITSLNADDVSVWFVSSEKSPYYGGGSRSKCSLRYSRFHEQTEYNVGLSKKIAAKKAKIEEIEQEIKVMIDQMDKRIGLEYFGL